MSSSKWCRDQRLYKAPLNSKTCDLQPLTAEDNKLRFADAVVDLKRNRLITVCEDHSKDGEAVNTISSVGQSSGSVALDYRTRDAIQLYPTVSKMLFSLCLHVPVLLYLVTQAMYNHQQGCFWGPHDPFQSSADMHVHHVEWSLTSLC